jgi:hypothetical protein
VLWVFALPVASAAGSQAALVRWITKDLEELMKTIVLRSEDVRVTGNFLVGACLRLVMPVLLAAGSPQYALGQSIPWVGTWGVAPAAQSLATSGSNPLTFNQQTLRQIVHTSVGGSVARIHISNVFGTGPLSVADVHIALSANNNG